MFDGFFDNMFYNELLKNIYGYKIICEILIVLYMCFIFV